MMHVIELKGSGSLFGKRLHPDSDSKDFYHMASGAPIAIGEESAWYCNSCCFRMLVAIGLRPAGA